jgi:hypothetical protein
MRYRLAIAALYGSLAKAHAVQAAGNAKEFVVEHKSEMTRTAVVSTAVYLAARANGFQAGYAFASNE